MNKDNTSAPPQKKKLVLRKESIKALDQEDLSVIVGGVVIGEGNPLPPDGGVPPKTP